MHAHRGLRLQAAISLLVIFTVITTTLVSWNSAAKALKASLTAEYLDNNYNLATKIAADTSNLLQLMQLNLAAMASHASEQLYTQEQLDLWKAANGIDFNSIFITDEAGTIQNISPKTVQFRDGTIVQQGTQVESQVMIEALAMRTPYISNPYQATSGQLIVMITAPIFDQRGLYEGLAAGTIYLESDSVLNRYFTKPDSEDGSYVYVVDQQGRMIYHPDVRRIRADVSDNVAVKKVLRGENGSIRAYNDEAIEYFTGYAHEPSTGWGIVSQTPVSVMNEPLRDLSQRMLLQSLPVMIAILLISALLVSGLTRPLNKLAAFSEISAAEQRSLPIEKLHIHSTIYEVKQLYYHMKNHIELLNRQIQLDGLTGIANRHTFDHVIRRMVEEKTSFSLILLDIDRFKNVNDTYGHLVGDEVLRYLTTIMNRYAKDEDLVFRYGGEEFGLLLKEADSESAYEIAERMRIEISLTDSPTGQPITISAGIASFRPSDEHPNTVIERADMALYLSKAAGRNRTMVSDEG